MFPSNTECRGGVSHRDQRSWGKGFAVGDSPVIVRSIITRGGLFFFLNFFGEN